MENSQTDLEDFIRAVAARAGTFPADERARFRALGYAIIEPAPGPCLLPAYDWFPDSFLALKSGDAQISLLQARRPYCGAWRRLRGQFHAGGYAITVIAPLPPFDQILARQGFQGPIPIGDSPETFADAWRLAPPATIDRRPVT